MLDLRALRADPATARAALARRGSEAELDRLLEVDEVWRKLQGTVDELRATRNSAAQAIGEAKKAGRDAAAEIAAAATLRDDLARAELAMNETEAARQTLLYAIPNLPDPSAADGMAEEDAVCVAEGGRKPEFAFKVRDHLELAGWQIDMERGARTSGSRFGYLLGDIARLHLATVAYAIDKLCGKGFTPVIPPVLVREHALVGSGIFPADREQVYALANADPELFLVGTSEVSLAALHAGEILDEAELPLRYCGHSACFRREAGASGKDTRGIFRTHQFEKVEMFVFCRPDESQAEHERILAIEREIADDLGLHYRVMNIAVGDLGSPAAKKYDIEAWMPGQDRYRELTSCSNTTDYQARRLNARFRSDRGVQHLHTLNGTAITSSRTLIAVLETHQREDGTVATPEVLQRFGAPATVGVSAR